MGGDWGVVMSWQDAAAHRHTWIVPRELVHGEPHVICRTSGVPGTALQLRQGSTGQSAALFGIGAPRPPTARRHTAAAGMA